MINTLTIIKKLVPCFMLVSCADMSKPSDPIRASEINIDLEPKVSEALVDYKRDSYRISLGEDYRLSDKTIDWFWAVMNDKDGVIDSNGFDSFKSLGVKTLEFENDKILPTLDILCYKNRIIEFRCSILFTIGDTHQSEMNFLRLISIDISRLRIDSVRNSIIKRGVYEISTKNYIEIYKLTKRHEHGYDKFEYTIKRIKNGR